METLMILTRSIARLIPLGPALLGLVLFAACSGDGGGSPTAPASPQLVLQTATLSVSGQVVNGMTLPQGHGQGVSTRFAATMVNLQGQPMSGQNVQVRYQRPQGMGMMNPSGTMMLYDDGTHGDRVPNDGLYCYEDWAGDYGCHTASSPMGQYHYEFWGQDHGGQHSNHMTVTVTIR
jgi:hypothetical protein